MVITRLISSFSSALTRVEDTLINAIYRHIQKNLCLADFGNHCDTDVSKKKFSINDIWDEGFLWGVPKHRRSIERRMSRRFGYVEWFWKPLVPKTNIITCRSCGHFHEAHVICNYCWEKVKAETKEIQEAIQEELKLDPVTEPVAILYEEEKNSKPKEFWKGQRIVELPKKRPSWFHSNLLERTTQPLSDSKDVSNPNDLA